MAPPKELSLPFSWKSSIMKRQSLRRFWGFSADAQSANGSTKRSSPRASARTPTRVKSTARSEKLKCVVAWSQRGPTLHHQRERQQKNPPRRGPHGSASRSGIRFTFQDTFQDPTCALLDQTGIKRWRAPLPGAAQCCCLNSPFLIRT